MRIRGRHFLVIVLLFLTIAFLTVGYRLTGYGWDPSRAQLHFSTHSTDGVPSVMRPEFEAAAETWNDVSGVYFSFTLPIPADVDNTYAEGISEPNGVSAIYHLQFFPISHTAETLQWHNVETSVLIESNTRLNAYLNWSTDLSTCDLDYYYDVQTTALHELGHILGLAHTQEWHDEAVMYFDYNGCQRSLAQDDINGFDAIYPFEPTGPPPCPRVASTFDMLLDLPKETRKILTEYTPSDFTSTPEKAERLEDQLRGLLESNQSAVADMNGFISENTGFMEAQDAASPSVIGTQEIHDATQLFQRLANATTSDELAGYLHKVEDLIPDTKGMTLKEALDYLSASLTGRKRILKQKTVPELQEKALGAYPNPFINATTLRYTLDEATHVTLVVYDVSGRKVATLVDARQSAGLHRVPFEAKGLASGVYLVRLKTGAKTQVEKIVVQK